MRLGGVSRSRHVACAGETFLFSSSFSFSLSSPNDDEKNLTTHRQGQDQGQREKDKAEHLFGGGAEGRLEEEKRLQM